MAGLKKRVSFARRHWAFVGALLAVCTAASSVLAAPATSGVSFSGSAQDFNLDLEATGTIWVQGTGEIHVLDEWYGKYHLDIDVPSQTKPVGLNPDTITFSSDPVGSATVGYDNITLGNRTLADANLNFNNGQTWNFAFDNIVFDMDVEDLGNVGLKLEISGAITAFSFVQDAGPVTAAGIYRAPGNYYYAYNASVNATLQDVIGGSDYDLGEISSTSDSSSSAGDLLGLMTLTDLGGPIPSDMKVELDLNTTGWPLVAPLDDSGTVVENQGHGSGNIDMTLNYVIDANLILSNLIYHLEDTVAGAILPEPGSLALMSMGILGALMGRRRRRVG